ncbi:hypothetical protein EVAR_7265_1 [Eumeta japonica]|uniref:Uncharacterized protein n=1 Tax=Eumeta variegata TaxID=151549 RepID=A0A4C1T3A9_EUMVA|nr:hypothetical protein EVAR_7265_1 [Eumeta japonica]
MAASAVTQGALELPKSKRRNTIHHGVNMRSPPPAQSLTRSLRLYCPLYPPSLSSALPHIPKEQSIYIAEFRYTRPAVAYPPAANRSQWISLSERGVVDLLSAFSFNRIRF